MELYSLNFHVTNEIWKASPFLSTPNYRHILMGKTRFGNTKKFVDTMAEIIAQKDPTVIEKIFEICSRLRGTYIPSKEFLLRHEKVKEVTKLNAKGFSVKEISARVGLRKSAIYNVLKGMKRK